eukprot:TRINITY_DN8396_c0_g1_i1.p1 TRINITY_DN8396_c0_g1~~TRINITY_DN8396_c0_g1_i1.p1  ORF type:complete len:565 (-),score=116.39 TRINITY_DN8396_c0_g1_i1:2009-3703(-)
MIYPDSKVIIANLRAKKLEVLALGKAVGKIMFAAVYSESIFVGNSVGQVFIYDDLKSVSAMMPRVLFSNAKCNEGSIVVQDPNVEGFEVWSPHELEGFYRSVDETCEHIKEVAGCALGKVIKIAATPRHRYDLPSIAMACKREEVELVVCTLDLSKAVTIKMNNPSELPSDIIWCGKHCVAGLYKNQIVLIDKTKNAIFPLKSALIHATTEIDGIRIYTEAAALFLEKVPDYITSIYGKDAVGESARYILELYAKYAVMDPSIEESFKNPVADEDTGDKPQDARSGRITTKAEAVIGLVRFAGVQLEPEMQKYLLKAAEFSEVIVPHTGDIRQEMQKAIKHLVTLNEYRKAGRMITYSEYIEQTPQGLVGMALKLQIPFLAYKIAEAYKGRGKELLAGYLDAMNPSIKYKKSEQAASDYDRMITIWRKSKSPSEFVDSIISKEAITELNEEWAATYQAFYKATKSTAGRVFQGIEKMMQANDKGNYAEEFRVKKRYVAVMRLRELARKGRWEEFLSYWNSVKPKISAITPVRLCLEYKNAQLANTLIGSVKDPEEQSNLLVEFK